MQLAPGDVHLWLIPLSGRDAALPRYRAWLSADEAARADRFYFERHRRRFTVARAALRQILGRYTALTPAGLVFAYGAKGKPELAVPAGNLLRFNLSHSDEFALLAVAEGLCLGVDIEAVKPDFGGEAIAERFFSGSEVATLRALAPAEKPEAFFSCWTRKEAYIKALGEGLSVPLDSFDVAFGPGVPAQLLRVRVPADRASRWSMYDIAAPPGYKAALVIEGSEHRLRQRLWEIEFQAP